MSGQLYLSREFSVDAAARHFGRVMCWKLWTAEWQNGSNSGSTRKFGSRQVQDLPFPVRTYEPEEHMAYLRSLIALARQIVGRPLEAKRELSRIADENGGRDLTRVRRLLGSDLSRLEKASQKLSGSTKSDVPLRFDLIPGHQLLVLRLLGPRSDNIT